jgi:hypothetical protein
MIGYVDRAWNAHRRAIRYDGVWTQGMECTQEGYTRYVGLARIVYIHCI